MAISVQWGSLWNSTPPALLCTARGGKTNRSTCIKRSSQGCETGDGGASCRNSPRRLWDSGFKPTLDFLLVIRDFSFPRVTNPEENHAGTLCASLLGCVSDAVWIPWRRLRGNRPGKPQRHQELTRCFGRQGHGHRQSESADLAVR